MRLSSSALVRRFRIVGSFSEVAHCADATTPSQR
jgi:hypothetical protein